MGTGAFSARRAIPPRHECRGVPRKLMQKEEIPEKIAQALASHRFERIAVFSGAGLSADSGVPTFRSGSNGLWNQFDPQQLATQAAWKNDKAMVWGWYEWRRGVVMAAEPNCGHHAVAQLQMRRGAKIVTQNVDNLHERAGAVDVLHLHGSLLTPRCAACRRPCTQVQEQPLLPQLRLPPPRCLHCGGYVRPGVVWFGEGLDPAIVHEVSRQIRECDLLLVVGTSSLVYPAADLVKLAPEQAVIVEINPHPAVANANALQWPVPAAVGLPALVERMIPVAR